MALLNPKKREQSDNNKVQDVHKEVIKQYINDNHIAILKEIKHKLQDDFKLNVSHTIINSYISNFSYSFKRVTTIVEKKNSDEVKRVTSAYVNYFINWVSRYGQDNLRNSG
jgi:uncharacterized protein YpuA (DUF1002 family)